MPGSAVAERRAPQGGSRCMFITTTNTRIGPAGGLSRQIHVTSPGQNDPIRTLGDERLVCPVAESEPGPAPGFARAGASAFEPRPNRPMRALGGRIRALPVCLPAVLQPAAILMRGKIGPLAERGDGGHENEGSGAMLLAIDVGKHPDRFGRVREQEAALSLARGHQQAAHVRRAAREAHPAAQLRGRLVRRYQRRGAGARWSRRSPRRGARRPSR